MSLSALLNATLKYTYHELPVVAVGSAASAALSFVVNRYKPFTLTLSNPMDAAKFTTAAIIGMIANKYYFSNQSSTGYHSWISLANRDDNSLHARASQLTCMGLVAYAVHLIANPENTITSFALLSIQAVASAFLAVQIVMSKSKPYDHYSSFQLDEVGFGMIQNVYQNIHRTVAAAGSAWLATRTFNTLGFDPKTTMIFTAATSAMYYATQPLFEALEHKTRNNISRIISLLSLTKIAADTLKLSLPLYQEFAKTCAVAVTLIAVFDNVDRCSSFWDNKSTYRAEERSCFSPLQDNEPNSYLLREENEVYEPKRKKEYKPHKNGFEKVLEKLF